MMWYEPENFGIFSESYWSLVTFTWGIHLVYSNTVLAKTFDDRKTFMATELKKNTHISLM